MVMTRGPSYAPSRTHGPINLGDDEFASWGNDQDVQSEWDTAQTQDAYVWWVSGSRTMIMADKANKGDDYAFAAQTDPTLIIFSATSAGSATDQYIYFQHDQTNAVIGVGTGSLSVNAAVLYAVNDATTNAVTTAATLRHNTTGTPANGIGVGLDFGVETSTTASTLAGSIDVIWTDVTHASRRSDMILAVETDNDGAMEELLRLDGSAGDVVVTAGLVLAAATAPAGTDVYAVMDNSGDLTLNALTGKTVNVAIAGTDEYTFSATDFTLADNNAVALGTGSDSRIYYDGTDTFWDLRAAGTGDLMIAVAGGFPSPDTRTVHVWFGAAGTVDAVQDSLVIENSSDVTLQFLGPAANQKSIQFGEPTDSPGRGAIRYNGSGHASPDVMTFRTASGDRLLLSANAFAFQEATTISTTAGNLSFDAASGSAIRLNDAQADVDVVIESDTADNLFHADAGLGTIGIGVAAGSVRMVDVYKDFGEPDTTTTGFRAQTVASETTASRASWIVGIEGSAIVGGTADAVTNTQDWTDTAALRAFNGIIQIHAGSSGSIDGAVYYARNASVSGATLGVQHAIYIEDMTSGGSDYGITIEGADTAAIWLSSAADNTDAANGIVFGSSKDTNLYRGAANVLVTDDSFFIGDTANANMDVGITIQQGTADNEAFAVKSSDIAHGLTAFAETDTYFLVRKQNATLGGVNIRAIAEDDAISSPVLFEAFGGTANTTKTTAGSALFQVYASEHDGANARANVTADGNVFAVQARVGSADVLRFLVDEDGDMYSVTAGQTFDAWDDVLMVRALDHARGDVIRTEWDHYVRYNEQTLIEVGVLGAPVSQGGMTNVTQLQRLHNGAIWQLYTRQREQETRFATVEDRIAALEEANRILNEENKKLRALVGAD